MAIIRPFRFRRKKEKMLSMEHYSDMRNSAYVSQSQPIINPNSKMARLIELIGYAIDAWAVEYHLESLPKEIIFGQALDAMRIIETTIIRKER